MQFVPLLKLVFHAIKSYFCGKIHQYASPVFDPGTGRGSTKSENTESN
jgi:hypothetical protein